MTKKEKLIMFLEHHKEEFYHGEGNEFCYCTNMVCTYCVLEKECKLLDSWELPPYISQENLKKFKEEYPEYFI